MKELYEHQIDQEVYSVINSLSLIIRNKLVELEDCSRRCNLRIDGVKETSNETWEKCEEHLETLFKDELGIEENVIIERAHRTKSSPESRRSKPRSIFCKFHNYKDKVKVLQNAKNLKGTNISINEDFSQETLAYRKELWKEMNQLRSEGKITYLNYRTSVCRERNDSYNNIISYPHYVVRLIFN